MSDQPNYSQLVSAITHAVPALWLFGYLYLKRRFHFRTPTAQDIYLFGVLAVLSMSGLYHFSRFWLWPVADLLRRLDHVCIALMWSTTMYALHKSHLPPKTYKLRNMIYLFSAALCALVKFIYFDELVGWPGFFVFVLFFSLSLWTAFDFYKRRLYSVLTYMSISGAYLFAVGAMERFKLFVLWEGVIEHHQIFHVSLIPGLIILFRAFHVKNPSNSTVTSDS